MIKKILSLLLSLMIIFTFAACKNDTDKLSDSISQTNTDTESDSDNKKEEEKDDEESNGITPLLYKVTDDNDNVAWLFGSVHIGEDDFYPLPDYIMNAFENADSLAVEFDITAFENDYTAQIEAMKMLLYMDGTTIKDHLPEETYNKAIEILKENKSYNSNMEYFIPSMWSMLIDQIIYIKNDIDIENGIDRHLIEKANKCDKEILDIESAEFQYGMLADYSKELQILLLESSIEEYYRDEDELLEELNKLLTVWKNGDEKEFIKFLSEEEEFESEEEKELYEEYNNAMLIERNKNMVEFAEEALQSGDEVFICVGAAHIVGEDAMVDLLKERGYKVKLIKP